MRKTEKRAVRVPKILDTSVIIDGRILEIIKTGFMEGPYSNTGICSCGTAPYSGLFRFA